MLRENAPESLAFSQNIPCKGDPCCDRLRAGGQGWQKGKAIWLPEKRDGAQADKYAYIRSS
ncbi:hypothetical protein AtDm6_2942 [Acetobacter tropicalis]|uniref:Uncharacterized protein n=1 Tax=Acetobacter tropicalis TaxID=104102 RepID=A0A094ZFF9_9PROT|nr:hypothetical protein AtDm6_2942 [Acetobacter tropicalis]